jgi:hypothetical protein
MLNYSDDALIMAAVVAAGVGFLFLLQRVWRSELRRQYNDLIGWHVGVLGSIYAVIIGFMLFAVWTNFATAYTNADSEANCLVDVARAARGLPPASRDRVVQLLNEYVTAMLTKEWPAMNNDTVSSDSHAVIRQLWATLVHIEPHTRGEQVSLDHTLTELGKMTEFRRLRQLQVNAYLPGILWFVLIIGGALTIIAACLFGASNFRLHLIQVIMLVLMISSILVAIADINHPFQGSLHVYPTSFERARDTLADLP